MEHNGEANRTLKWDFLVPFPLMYKRILGFFFFFFFPGEALVKGQMKPTRKEMKAAGGL